jgi:hypothetical protein
VQGGDGVGEVLFLGLGEEDGVVDFVVGHCCCWWGWVSFFEIRLLSRFGLLVFACCYVRLERWRIEVR